MVNGYYTIKADEFFKAKEKYNVVPTCVSVSLKELLNSALSAMLRYCLSRNFFSSARSCWVVNGVRGLRLGLCFRSAQRTTGDVGVASPIPGTRAAKIETVRENKNTHLGLENDYNYFHLFTREGSLKLLII